MSTDGNYDLDEILSVAKEAATLAGTEIRRAVLARDNSTTTTGTTSSTIQIKSDTTDLVTETDQRCEQLVMDLIQTRYPTHCLIGEESSGADCQYQLTDAPT